MGKFTGMLLVSDYDNTLLYTDPTLKHGAPMPPMPQRNLDAIRYWMGEGGVFAVATGRSLAAYRRAGQTVPTNAPTIVDNGGAIYDFRTGEYVLTRFLPAESRERIRAVADAFPDISLELYRPGDRVLVLRPCPWNDQHAKLTGAGYEVLPEITAETLDEPICKALFVGEPQRLEVLRRFIRSQDWGREYELIFSSGILLEMTALGAHKGEMVRKLQALCGCHKLYCAGDHANDLPMLRSAARGFCPANAIPEVLHSGATVVCHCLEGAIGDIVEIIGREEC